MRKPMLVMALGLAHAAQAAPDDDAWRTRWLAYDANGDGQLDAGEVVTTPCEAWRALDDQVRDRWGSGLMTVYGFMPDKHWVGGVLGIADEARSQAAAHLATCGLSAEFQPTTLSARLRGLSRGGSEAWDAAVRRIFAPLDADGSGAIDTPEEVAAIDCESWRALDDGVRERWAAGLVGTYGLGVGQVWIGDALGVRAVVGDAVREALRTCDVRGADERMGAPPDPVRMARAIGSLPQAGGGAWSEVVRSTLLTIFDGDGSGGLGDPAELRAVPCAVWKALDVPLREQTGRGLIDAYGFAADDAWRGHALGIEGSARALAEDAIQACLADAGATGTERLSPVPGPDHRSADAVRAWFLRYDLDRSGQVDHRSEILAVPCGAWRALERGAQDALGIGVVERFGLKPGGLWTGDSLGLSRRVARRAYDRARRCTLAVQLAPRGDQPR